MLVVCCAAPRVGERPHAVRHAIALAAAVVVVRGLGLRGGTLRRRVDHILDIRVQHGRVQRCPARRTVVRKTGPQRRRHRRKTAGRRCARPGIDEVGQRLPQRTEAVQDAHAGVRAHRGVTRIAALVGRRVVDERRHRCRNRGAVHETGVRGCCRQLRDNRRRLVAVDVVSAASRDNEGCRNGDSEGVQGNPAMR